MYLIASLVALLFGPVAGSAAAERTDLRAGLDGFVLVAILGIVGIEVLPTILHSAGPVAILFLIAGLVLPWALETAFWRATRIHDYILWLAAMALALHGFTDGIALAIGDSALEGTDLRTDLLALSVFLHRLPIGLMLWWLIRSRYGAGSAITALVILGIGTLTGFALGDVRVLRVPPITILCFEAFVAGSLMHAMVHPVTGHGHESHTPVRDTPRRSELLGNVLGIAAVALAFWLPSHVHGSGELEGASLVLATSLIFAPYAMALYLVFCAVAWVLRRNQTPMSTVRKITERAAPGLLVLLPILASLPLDHLPRTYDGVHWSAFALILCGYIYLWTQKGVRRLFAEIRTMHTHHHSESPFTGQSPD